MNLKKYAIAAVASLFATGAWAGCSFENTVPLKSLTAGFAAWSIAGEARAVDNENIHVSV